MQFKNLQTSLFLFLLVSATVLFGWLINDFILPVFWSIVLTIIFYPIHKRILAFTRGRAALSALISIALILIIVLVPMYILGALVANEAVSLYLALTQGSINSLSIVSQIQTLISPLATFGINIDSLHAELLTLAQNFSAQIGTYALDIGRATANTLVATLLMLYILFFTLRDGAAIGERVMKALPLGDSKEKMLFDRFVGIVHAMFKGTFIVALIQGGIGGILFAVVGIKSAALWAFVMALFALIPAVGPVIVWVPIGLFLLFTGAVWQGIAVLAVGAFVISLIDNLLRPILVAKGAAMPDVLVLLSVLGGLALFGIAGIIIGPVITAFFLSMWQLFEYDYADELKKFG